MEAISHMPDPSVGRLCETKLICIIPSSNNGRMKPHGLQEMDLGPQLYDDVQKDPLEGKDIAQRHHKRLKLLFFKFRPCPQRNTKFQRGLKL